MKVRVASAGTGKTTSLVARFLSLIGEGEPLRRLAGVTFTRSAAAELRDRVGEGIREVLATGSYLGTLAVAPEGSAERYEEALRELDGATLTTIHGFMRVGLRLSAPLLGVDPDFGSLPEWEAQAIFEEELEGLLLASEEEAGPWSEAAARLGERATERVLALFRQRSLAESIEPADGDEAAAAAVTLYRAAYARFEARTGRRRLAPSEVERRALELVRAPQALARLAARAPRVIVDEYQDVNPLQGRFFAALERGGVRVEVVGDPKQSIYGFRHADVEVFRAAFEAADVRGDVPPPLTESRRHAQVVVRFLNALTRAMASKGWGFGPSEAPDVTGAGSQAEVRGRVEIHWVQGAARIDELRPSEAVILAERLEAAHERGRPWSDMAVLARSYHVLDRVRRVLLARGIPAVLRQGRGYYERSEIRDLAHALRVGIDPHDRAALATWARGPYAGLAPGAIDALMRADDPRGRLAHDRPDVAGRLTRIEAATTGTPLDALRTLVREPMIDGMRFVDLLTERQRRNVDALLFEVAERPPSELELLLDRLDALSREAKEAGDVPAEGEGVTLITVHGSKGLEWPVVALADVGAQGSGGRPAPLHLDEGRVHLPGGPGFRAASQAVAAREAQERYRLLYVAASRAKDELILAGSVTDRGPMGWAQVLAAMNLGPDGRQRDRDDFVLQVHGPRSDLQPPASTDRAPDGEDLQEAPWTDRRFPRGDLPPVESPSRIRRAVDDDGRATAQPDVDDAEPLRPGAATETTITAGLPGQAVAVGTLLHDAIRRDADPDDADEIELLRAQEVMFPYDADEQGRLLDEVREMLGSYHALLGRELPALHDRERDLREWPVVLPSGRQVWQGVIDRLYLADGVWYLDDYKTDRTLVPERYAFQLAVYREAVRQVLGVDPVTRLVGLRDGAVIAYAGGDLEEAWRHGRSR